MRSGLKPRSLALSAYLCVISIVTLSASLRVESTGSTGIDSSSPGPLILFLSSSFIKSTKPFCINPQPSTLLCSNSSTPSLYQPQTPQLHCPSTLPTPLSYALCVCVTWCVCVCLCARVCHSILNPTPTKVLVFATLDTTSVVAGIPTGRTPNLGSFLF